MRSRTWPTTSCGYVARPAPDDVGALLRRGAAWLRCDTGELGLSVASVVGSLVDEHHSVAVIASASLHGEIADGLAAGASRSCPTACQPRRPRRPRRPELAKGLNFDAVVVTEPRPILDEPGGAGLLYIALTRAVQFLVVLYSGELPAALGAAA